MIKAVTSTLNVKGDYDVGGLVGHANDWNDGNGNVKVTKFLNVLNTGTVTGNEDVGGIVGHMDGNTTLGVGEDQIPAGNQVINMSHNLGKVTGESNVGGLVGYAEGEVIIGGIHEENDKTDKSDRNALYNNAAVEGNYNVGGIVGYMKDTTVDNVANYGTVTAKGSIQDTYTYQYTADEKGTETTKETVEINAANAGGIAGNSSNSTIKNVTNSADITTSWDDETKKIYHAGNVGGIVGKAVDTDVDNAVNLENNIRGANNVGGIVGELSGTSRITNSINNGGDISGTGARWNNGFVTERPRGNGNQGTFNVGNIGGIVGYLSGDDAHINASGNRGSVHTEYNTDLDSSRAVNIGGIVGKLDTTKTFTTGNSLGTNYANASVSNSYNTGDVQGYTGIGGIAGFMYNGAVAGSYNIGHITTTRKDVAGNAALNLGGIVGDTEEVEANKAFIYDVYNKGEIGDKDFTYYGRHVGGIVGRLSGKVEKAYNAGPIYNAYPVTGGIVGFWYKGDISNVFNTGNITVVGNGDATSQVGGLIGSTGYNNHTYNLKNAYNLGALRVFKGTSTKQQTIGGIIGEKTDGTMIIKNVYTLGNLYASESNAKIGDIIGLNNRGTVQTENVYYIKPKENSGFSKVSSSMGDKVTSIEYADRYDATKYVGFFTDPDNTSTTDGDWRIYDKTTPILNAFKPVLAENDNYKTALEDKDYTIQFGTAYDPVLSIIRTKENITLRNANRYIGIHDGIAVYGGGLTLTDPDDTNSNLLFGGLLYSDGALIINGHASFGSASRLYGSSVTINDEKGKVDLHGTIIATGNADGKTITDENNGKVQIIGKSINSYGSITSVKDGDSTMIDGIAGEDKELTFKDGDIQSKDIALPTVESGYGHEVTAKNTSAGNVDITATEGDVNLYYGENKNGFINAAGDINVTSTNGKIFSDSDLHTGTGKINLTGDNEMVLDVSNIGKVDTANRGVTGPSATGVTSVDVLYDFLGKTTVSFNHTDKENTSAIDGKIAIDMSSDDGTTLNFDKYDKSTTDTLAKHIQDFNSNLQFTGDRPANAIYNWISNADQLNYIQKYYDDKTAAGATTGILTYNFALKNNIDASGIAKGDYKAIGSGKDAYTGTFDGRDYRISGLTAEEGLFGTIGENGTVRNLRVYSSSFKSDSADSGAGAIAQTNKGTIESVIGLGNTVSGTGTIGGLVAKNEGTIVEGSDQSSIIGADGNTTVGGLVGTNTGKVINSMSNSAITGSGSSMGGIAGTNSGEGVIYDVSSNGISGKTGASNIGGIVGSNNSKGGDVLINGETVTAQGIEGAYNDSVILGTTNVGGIVGKNDANATIAEVANGESITGKNNGSASDKVGGLAGTNSGNITDGRNTGTITGNKNVGGLVGVNENNSSLKNLENGPSASIVGITNVGGIAGWNEKGATIDAKGSNLTNDGTITGNIYVGGVAGLNDGTISNINSNIVLHADGENAQYFGGIAGKNSNTGVIQNANNTAEVSAENATYVGGIAGWNDGSLQGASNSGNVTGKSFVGGVAGLNTRDLKGYNDGDGNATTKEDILIQNSGNVTANEGGAGGIFGENQGTIGDDAGNKHIILSNSGNVTGNDENVDSEGTGGIIGVNKGKISHTSLRNEVKWDETKQQYTPGNVTGTNNVGGVIGLNYGKVSGGRNVSEEPILDKDGKEIGTAAAGSYYKYQILNNGAVSGTSNIGGLVGKNMFGETQSYKKDDGTLSEIPVDRNLTGEIHAGYNTGSVTASGSNVGGIVGTNASGATVDQVFSTLANNNTVGGSEETVEHVGGLIGNNEGTLTNSYATHTVNGKNGSTGNAVGTNSGSISNVYSSATSGKLIGAANNGSAIENAYTFVGDDTSIQDVKPVTDEKKQKSKDGYNGFDFNATWKLYDGNSNALLKVFLNKVTVKDGFLGDDGRYHITYNGKTYDVTQLKDKLTAANGKNFAENDNTKNSTLLGTKDNILHAGDYDDAFWSQQIDTNGKDRNPNNLGYDIDVDLTVDKAVLKVEGNEVIRTYGDTTILNGGQYGVTVKWDDSTVDGGKYTFDGSKIEDGALTGNTTGKVTNDVNTKDDQTEDYTWSGKVSLTDEEFKNFTLDKDHVAWNDQNGKTVDVVGKSYVNKANLTIHAKDTEVYAGWTPKYDGTVGPLVNGDSWNTTHFGVADANKSQESQVGVHERIIGLWVNGTTFLPLTSDQLTEPAFLKNYNIDVKPGTLTVVDGVPPVEPDSHLDYFLKDAPWDRQENFRERKAEIHFIAGGMTL